VNKQYITIAAFCVACISFTASCNSGKNADKHEHTAAGEQEHIYSCPMHPEVTGKEGDKCSKCGMALVHTDNAAPAGNFRMKFNNAAEIVEAGKPHTLSFTPVNNDDAAVAVPLAVQHEKKIHLIAVSEDLSWFHHIHPEYQADGSYTVTETFPHGGSFILYADYMPAGAAHQLEKMELRVKGKEPVAETYTAEKQSATSGNYAVTLKPDGGKFVSGTGIHFDGVFTKNGQPLNVNQLQNYLGAKGHMVAIHTTTKEYVHLHPEVEGEILHFHAAFPSAGIYRVWLQFMADGELHTVDFVLQVVQGAAPAQNNADGHNH
jgi:hypothetical protein